MEKGLIAVDNGGFTTCIATRKGLGKFPSAKGMYMERNLVSKHGKHDYIVEVNGKKYMAGTLAVESKFPLQMHTKTKAHDFYDISVLMAIHLYGYDINIVIVSVPISQHKDSEKESIRKRLIGEWEITINGIKKKFIIEDVKVAPETVSAFWGLKPKPLGKVRWIDWGSRTVGYGTTINDGAEMRFLNKESGTFEREGMDALDLKVEEVKGLADYVGGKLLAKWDSNDKVYHIGGGVLNRSLIDRMKEYFPNSEALENPQVALAYGMYVLGRGVYGDGEGTGSN